MRNTKLSWDKFPPRPGQATEPQGRWRGNGPQVVLGWGHLALGSSPTRSPFHPPAGGQWRLRMSHREKDVTLAGLCPICDLMLRLPEHVLTLYISSHLEAPGATRSTSENLEFRSFSTTHLSAGRRREQLGECLPSPGVDSPTRASWTAHKLTDRHHFNKLQNDVPYRASLKATELPPGWRVVLKPWWAGTVKIGPVSKSPCRTYRLQ